jgi:hypothetical protein
MLCAGEPYRYALPESTQTKLAAVRILATGQRRKGGAPKGQKSVAKIAPGVRSREVKSLPQLYCEEGLPELRDPKSGDSRMIEQCGAAEFAASVLVVRRRRKATPQPA